jgi:primosomal protein N' (replication factor Y)
LTYLSEEALALGTLVRVPLGQRELLGIVWPPPPDTAEQTNPGKPVRLRNIAGVLAGLQPLKPSWQTLVRFTASYYQRSEGEVALAALPPSLRELSPVQLTRRLQRQSGSAKGKVQGIDPSIPDVSSQTGLAAAPQGLALTTEQEAVLGQIVVWQHRQWQNRGVFASGSTLITG